MNNLGIKNFFDTYIFHPLSTNLSGTSQIKALALSIIGGVFTCGILHLGILAFNLIRFKGRISKQSNQNSTDQKIVLLDKPPLSLTIQDKTTEFSTVSNKNKEKEAKNETLSPKVEENIAGHSFGQEASNLNSNTLQSPFSEPSLTSEVSKSTESVAVSNKVNEEKIREELTKYPLSDSKKNIDEIVKIIKEIVDHSTLSGQPITYDEQGMAYLRKNEHKIPYTLQVNNVDGQRHVYIHLKSKKTNQVALIGEACQKVVYRAINQSGEIVAASVIKEENMRNLDPKIIEGTFNTEKQALELFHEQPYILQHYHAYRYSNGKANQGETKYGLITEYCNGTADSDFLNYQLTLKERWVFFLNILKGVKAIHEKGYCHFDLKSENILYKIENGKRIPKIIDFGVMHPMNEVIKDNARGGVLPPEYKIHENFPITVTEKVDVWSLGVYAAYSLMNIMINTSQEYLLNDKGEYIGKKAIVTLDCSSVPKEMKPFKPIIKKMLDADANKRLSLESAIKQISEAIEKMKD